MGEASFEKTSLIPTALVYKLPLANKSIWSRPFVGRKPSVKGTAAAKLARLTVKGCHKVTP